MRISLRVFIILFLILECVSLIFDPATLYSQTAKSNSHQDAVLDLRLGFAEDGTVTPEWIEVIRYLRNEPGMSAGQFGRRRLTKEEAAWANLIKRKVLIWPDMVDSLRIPFGPITPPDTVRILLGYQGGEDAFVYTDSTICFDLNRLNRVYGGGSESANSDRIDRFFAHEYTHILHKAWRREHPLNLDSPLDVALWVCLTEGLGNYRSLSDKWTTGKGELTDHAKKVLERLQLIFIQRILLLKHASDGEAAALMEGLSMGPFDQKWGALTVALWLAREAKGDDANLQKWVDRGPPGILMLAQKYLPEDLKGAMPKITEK